MHRKVGVSAAFLKTTAAHAAAVDPDDVRPWPAQRSRLQLADGGGDERREHDVDACRHCRARLTVQQCTVRQMCRYLPTKQS